jgi:serine/threonine protein kinase
MEIDREKLAEEFRRLERLPANFDAEAECEHLDQLVREELVDYLAQYDDPEASGAGGSGLVINAVYKPFGNRRSIKFPRKKAQVSLDTEEDPFVDPEVHALSKVSHQNITRLYDTHGLAKGGYCMITEHVEKPKALDEYATILCCSEECRKSEYALLSKSQELARIVYQVADALVYMHDSAGLLHFDIKPDNILVSANGHPFVTDLGFARDLTRYAAGTTVEVGFTFKYAHPSLTDPDLGARGLSLFKLFR